MSYGSEYSDRPNVPVVTVETGPIQDSKGRFIPGNKAGQLKRVSMLAGRQAQYRRAFHEAIDNEEMRALARVMYGIALTGDIQAARLVLEHTIGKPVEATTEIESTNENGSLVINLVPARSA